MASSGTLRPSLVTSPRMPPDHCCKGARTGDVQLEAINLLQGVAAVQPGATATTATDEKR